MSDMVNLKSIWRQMVADARKLSVGGYLLIGSMLALLTGVIVFASVAWSLGEEADVPSFGYAAMAAGIAFAGSWNWIDGALFLQ
jgi:hypothetical protein